ncbi:hypothetical protein CEXT_361251 [Caerostris extrusa]|uniref:Uncharacterized protein n=1 Tax=Caerostris extrusa TaxID=172846 RepID=A0AAV4Y799_CAEEX|nr:hypothetical protein CEXT_361251 [Caerostris extrusa]
MKLACVFVIACMVAMASGLQTCKSQSDCSGTFCVKTMGMMSFCRSAAKKGGLCSVTQGANGVYNNLPPCTEGLKCQGTILTCH